MFNYLSKTQICGALEASKLALFQTCVRRTSPTWCLQANQRRGRSRAVWMEMQAAEIAPVLELVVSNTMPATESVQFQVSSRSLVAAEICGPTFSRDLWGSFGTPSSLTPPAPNKNWLSNILIAAALIYLLYHNNKKAKQARAYEGRSSVIKKWL